MLWTFIGGAWYSDDGTAGTPGGLPAKNPATSQAWKNNDRFDDAPTGPAAPFSPGWRGNEYGLHHNDEGTHGILIDSHQRKHITSWPGNYAGKPGTKFPKDWTTADVIAYAELLVTHSINLRTTPTANRALSNERINVQYQPAGKVAVKAIIINSAAWDAAERYWAFHFYPG